MFDSAVRNYGLPIDENIINLLEPTIVQEIVKRLEPARIKGTNLFTRFLEGPTPGSIATGVYYTPSSLTNLISRLFDYGAAKFVLDPAVGTGGFLADAAKYTKKRKGKTPKLIGVDKNANAVTLASARLGVANALDNTTLLRGDFLLPEVQEKLRDIVKKGFDFIVCNPPFGFNLGRSIEGEFVKAILGQLKDGGEAAILLPDSFLFSQRSREIRENLIKASDLLAVISLPNDLFSTLSSIKLSIVIFRKKPAETLNGWTLFLKMPDGLNIDELEILNVDVIRTFKHFIRTGNLKKIATNQLAPSIQRVSQQNGYRMDYFAYAPEYIQAIEHLKRIDAELVALSDVAKIRLGELRNEKASVNLPVISVRDLIDGWFDAVQPSMNPSQFDLFDFEDVRLKPGDLLMSSVLTSENLVFLVPENIKPVQASRYTLVITPNRSKVHPAYLFALFRNELIKTQLKQLSIGSTMRNVTPRLVGEILIPLIPMERQEAVARRINQYYEYQFAVRRALEQIDTEVNILLGIKNEGGYDEIS